MLRRPRPHAGHPSREAAGPGKGAATREHRTSVGVEQFVGAIDTAGGVGRKAQFEESVEQTFVERRDHLEIEARRTPLAREVDAALDAAHAPEVLALEPGARAPAVDFDHEVVVAPAQQGGDVVANGILRILEIARLAAVHIDIDTGLRAAQVEIDRTAAPGVGDAERTEVDPHGRRLGQLRRLRIDRGELVDRIDVDRRAVALHLPVARDADRIPGGRFGRGRRGDVGRQLPGRIIVAEAPLAIERAVVRTPLEGEGERLGACRVEDDLRTAALAVHVEGGGILPIGSLCGGGRRGKQQQGGNRFFHGYRAVCTLERRRNGGPDRILRRKPQIPNRFRTNIAKNGDFRNPGIRAGAPIRDTPQTAAEKISAKTNFSALAFSF